MDKINEIGEIGKSASLAHLEKRLNVDQTTPRLFSKRLPSIFTNLTDFTFVWKVLVSLRR